MPFSQCMHDKRAIMEDFACTNNFARASAAATSQLNYNNHSVLEIENSK